MNKIIQWVTLGLALSCTVLAQAAKPVFLITPVTKAPSTIYAGQTVTASYNITNNTPYALEGNGIVNLPVGVTQAGGGCTTPFNLASGASCTLVLQIVADELNGSVRGGPKVCNTLTNPIYCSQPSAGNELNTTKSNTPPPAASFTISGAISGLTANGLVLQNNGADDVTVSSGEMSFEFATPVAYGGGYTVTVAAQPTGLTCTPSNNVGTNVTANVSNVSIVCSPITYSIGGTVGGLNASGLIIRNNNDTATDITIDSSATSFVFPAAVAYGGGYDVTVVQSPPGLTCTASNNAGTNVMADVTDVSIVCNPITYSIGGTVSGLNAPGLIIRNNNDAATDLPINSGATDFVFPTEVAYGGSYDVTVVQSPPGLTCTASNNSGNNVMADVTDVEIECALGVGDAYGGGVIYRIDGSTAYILSLEDVAASVTWGPITDVATNLDNTFNTTTDNTYDVLAGSNFPAAAACRDYSVESGANTWFLPARNEWPLIVENITTINDKAGVSGFTQFTAVSEYWSSTQNVINGAFARYFSSASASIDFFNSKNDTLRVRCVRALTI